MAFSDPGEPLAVAGHLTGGEHKRVWGSTRARVGKFRDPHQRQVGSRALAAPWRRAGRFACRRLTKVKAPELPQPVSARSPNALSLLFNVPSL